MSTYGYGYGQYGVDGYGEAVISRAFVGALTVVAGEYSQLQLVDTYQDGNEVAIAEILWESSNPYIAYVDQTGTVYGLNIGTANITATSITSIGYVLGVVQFTVTANTQAGQVIPVPNFYSHLTQVLQNYFDWKDSRIRSNKYPIDAQFLNISAQQLQISSLEIAREIGATTLHSCPTNIDNGGCYYKQTLPNDFDYQQYNPDVAGVLGSTSISLVPYNDSLPVPTRVTANSDYTPVPLTSTSLFSISGIGVNSPQSTSWACQRVGPLTPALVNRLHFWLDGSGYEAINVQIKITGYRAPIPPWSALQKTSSETITLSSIGWRPSKFAWGYISTIQVLGLPVGMTLKGYIGTFSLPQQPDLIRPYTDPMFRDVQFPRYWSTSETGFLTETYLKSNYEGWDFAQYYTTAVPFRALAVEPNTWGAFAAAGTTLYYFDRREPMPAQAALAATAITTEPYYGLNVTANECVDSVYSVTLTPVAYSGATSTTSYRYLVVSPNSTKYVILPNGVFAEYTESAGWRSGPPPTKPVIVSLGSVGTYIFTLQTAGPSGVLYDSVPWQNLSFTPLVSLDLSSLVPQISGLYFDDRNRLWVWTGTYAVPIKLHYDAYIIDQPTQSIYLTDAVEGLSINGIVV